ncbi:molybdate ABC transporter substrate-binding protein [Parasalinivibrio latis]|uniref:molybdate ABC transporter substrate-binding protein n=1 Tax=Parasalinivibrio latis TaxID=2952610 RepID=UPI0030E115E6
MKLSFPFLKKAIKPSVLVAISALVSTPVFAKDITVFAAASMTNALNQIVDIYNKDHADKAVVSYASSSTLARQISQGAPADIYISANERWMDYLQKQGLLNDRRDLAANELVIVSSLDNVKKVVPDAKGIEDINKAGRIAVGDPQHVPAGIYARQTLESLGVWNKVQNNLARANNVRSALALVERGESPYGIVYETDAEAAKNVHIVAVFPSSLHTPITYPAAMIGKEPSKEVKAFYQFLNSAQAGKILQQHGFSLTGNQ